MPEVAVAEDRDTPLAQHEVGATGKIPRMGVEIQPVGGTPYTN